MSEVLRTHSSDTVSKGLSAARRRGVVFAALASLAILASPIQAAFGAVTQVREVDDPGRIAYQSTAACVLDVNACGFDFPRGPTNHRLVIQHISGSLVGNPTGAQVQLFGGANGAVSSFIAPPSFQGQSQFDQPVLQYFDAGSAPSLTAVADTTLISFSSATLSGYLLDCATTPCAAIAK
jgi:hypothetical protein